LESYNDEESQSPENQSIFVIFLFDKRVYRILAMTTGKDFLVSPKMNILFSGIGTIERRRKHRSIPGFYVQTAIQIFSSGNKKSKKYANPVVFWGARCMMRVLGLTKKSTKPSFRLKGEI
jgi:hypothetical protein